MAGPGVNPIHEGQTKKAKELQRVCVKMCQNEDNKKTEHTEQLSKW